jgi:hypothetical protein
LIFLNGSPELPFFFLEAYEIEKSNSPHFKENSGFW